MVSRARPLGPRALIFLFMILCYLTAVIGSTENQTLDAAVGVDGGTTVRLSQEAMESIAGLDDHPIEDNDAARADRILAALQGLPEHERIHMGLDLEHLRRLPLQERLIRLQEVWAVRQLELKEAYEAIPKVKELLGGRIKILEDSSASESAQLTVLIDLEDLLSDIDMARDFHTLGGFSALVSMLHVSQPETIREMAAWTIGTAVRNEPTHQRWVLEEGPEQVSLLDLLLDNTVVATTPSLRSKLVYALSACLSNNADVQLRFGSQGGQEKLSIMYGADGSEFRLRIKVLTLLSDLLQEAARGSPAAVLAIVPVGTTPTSGGIWCERVDGALREASSPATLEKVLEAVISLAPSCRGQLDDLGTRRHLEGLAEQLFTFHPPAGLDWEGTEFDDELAQLVQRTVAELR